MANKIKEGNQALANQPVRDNTLTREEREAVIAGEQLEKRKAYQALEGVSFFKFLAALLFGASIFTSQTTKYNPYYIVFGILVFWIFIFLFKRFLKGFLGLFNPIIKKEIDRKVVGYAVDNSMLFMIPFALMSFISTYVLGWAMSTAFLSTGIMAVGTAAAIEVGKLRAKPALKNTLLTSAISFGFSFVLILFIGLIGKVPGLIEGATKLIPSLLGKGGMGL